MWLGIEWMAWAVIVGIALAITCIMCLLFDDEPSIKEVQREFDEVRRKLNDHKYEELPHYSYSHPYSLDIQNLKSGLANTRQEVSYLQVKVAAHSKKFQEEQESYARVRQADIMRAEQV